MEATVIETLFILLRASPQPKTKNKVGINVLSKYE
jgi:hypothetical protein